jgi:hypothetical protein
MEKFCNLIDVPNNLDMLTAAHKNLYNLLKTKQLSSKQIEIVNDLLNVFYNH